MPLLDTKKIQKDLESKKVWPVYWIYGPEKLKERELVKRIRTVVLGPSTSKTESLSSSMIWNEEIFDAENTSFDTIIDAANTLSWGVKTKLIIVKNSQHIKDLEGIKKLCGLPQNPEAMTSVCIFLAKDWDGRKKISKVLLEHAAVIECENVAIDRRETWIHFLAKRRNIDLQPDWVFQLIALDPWSLDYIDQELEKLSLSEWHSDHHQSPGSGFSTSDKWIENFMNRRLDLALPQINDFSDQPDIYFPLLGLLNWNLKFLIQEIFSGIDTKNSYLKEKLNRWKSFWNIEELLELQQTLSELDFSLKQTAHSSQGNWASLVMKFCK